MRKILAVILALSSNAAAYGQSGAVTNHAYAIGKGPGVSGYTSLLCASGQLAVGSAADPICRTVGGDAIFSAAGNLTLNTVNSNVGSFGSTTNCPSFTVNGKGLVTAASQAGCAFPTAANPTATAGPTAVNGAAATYMRSDAAPAVQLGSAAQKGVVQVDGTTITAAAGVVTAALPVAANPTATAGPAAVNGAATTFMRSDGAPAVQLGTAAQKGIVQVDGTTITAAAGVITATLPTAANPTATAGPAAVNGAATTFMRSDGAPAVQKASAAQFGIVEVDGTTITAAAGVITAALPTAANPTATAGPAAANGSAATFMRSDAAPAVQKGSNTVFGITHGDGTTVDCTGTAGICVAKVNAILPTPTRAGDVAYWNGTAWVTLAGNNSGTQVFSENSSGVPAWLALAAVATSGSASDLSAGTLPAARTNGHMNGEPSSGTAAAGEVGQILSNSASPSLTTATSANCGSITLTAGDWNIWASAIFSGSGVPAVTDVRLGISTTTGVLPSTVAFQYFEYRTGTAISDFFYTPTVGPMFVQLSGSNTYFCVAQATFASGSYTAQGVIQARRAR